MSIIELKNIIKTYGAGDGAVSALQGISCKIEEGESVAIMGKSGCGKSTLLNILGFVDQPTEGAYLLDGRESRSFTPKEKANIRNKKLGFVVQDFALIPRLTVEDNIMLPLEYTKYSKKEKEKRVDDLLEKIDLKEKKHTYPANLSGGQKQRVAIARALVNDANILLCDEPTGALDSKTTKEIMEIFMKLHHEEHKTLVIVTHDTKVSEYCERVIYLSDGKIVENFK